MKKRYSLLIIPALCLMSYMWHLSGPARGPASESLYKLPWPGGEQFRCIQGNNFLLFTHKGIHKYAFDFDLPEGTPVLAARGGVVEKVVDKYSENSMDKEKTPNNEIYVDHGDGTRARYVHISQNSAEVGVGQEVSQGDFLALSGNVGLSLNPHLHFEVVDSEENSQPISFSDVKRFGGVPKMLWIYTSGNKTF